jgi:hypothetical protein
MSKVGSGREVVKGIMRKEEGETGKEKSPYPRVSLSPCLLVPYD